MRKLQWPTRAVFGLALVTGMVINTILTPDIAGLGFGVGGEEVICCDCCHGRGSRVGHQI